MNAALRRPALVAGVVITLALAAIALFSLVWTPYPVAEINIAGATVSARIVELEGGKAAGESSRHIRAPKDPAAR